jgi:hypothetical protein
VLARFRAGAVRVGRLRQREGCVDVDDDLACRQQGPCLGRERAGKARLDLARAATAGSADNCRACLALGADRAINCQTAASAPPSARSARVGVEAASGEARNLLRTENEPATGMRAPNAMASWIAVVQKPLVPPRTSNHSPAEKRPLEHIVPHGKEGFRHHRSLWLGGRRVDAHAPGHVGPVYVGGRNLEEDLARAGLGGWAATRA